MIQNVINMKEEKLIELMRKIRFQEKFKIPTPTGGQTEDEFISGCMSTLKDEFPDQAQRYAVCKKSWDEN